MLRLFAFILRLFAFMLRLFAFILELLAFIPRRFFPSKEISMRLILIGTEYTGKTALSQSLMDWGHERGIHHHMDDHFSIPDCQMLKTVEDREIMLGLPQIIKERYQRFQLAYHVRLINKYEHILLSGFHLEEYIYGPRYYYPDIGRAGETPQAWEAGMPDDTILVHLTARPEVIQKRMEEALHDYPVVPGEDIQEVQEQFQSAFRASWIKRKFQIDTSELTPEALLQTFLDASVPHLNARDLLFRSAASTG